MTKSWEWILWYFEKRRFLNIGISNVPYGAPEALKIWGNQMGYSPISHGAQDYNKKLQ